MIDLFVCVNEVVNECFDYFVCLEFGVQVLVEMFFIGSGLCCDFVWFLMYFCWVLGFVVCFVFGYLIQFCFDVKLFEGLVGVE